MFSADDAKEVFQLLAAENDFNNPLIPAAHGDGFVTRKHTRKAFEDLVTKVYVNQRVSITSLSRDLDVSAETVRTLVEEHEGTILLRSGNGREIISKAQRDAIDQEFESGVVYGLVSRDVFARKHDLSPKSVDLLIETSNIDIVETNGYLYSTSYDMTASGVVAKLLSEHLEKQQVFDLKSTNVPGSPPTWFINRTVNSLLEDQEFAGKFHVHVLPEGIQCNPVQLVKQVHDNTIDDLQTGKKAYVDLADFYRSNQAIYPSQKDAENHLASTLDIDILGDFAISNAWILKFSEECAQSLTDESELDLGQALRSRVPDFLQMTVFSKTAELIESLSHGSQRIGDSILTENAYSRQYDALIELAKSDAISQWQKHKEDPKTEIKFSTASITSQIPAEKPLLHDMIKVKATERSLDNAFSGEISGFEKQNEGEFSNFWVDRVVARAAIYSEGLRAVEDEKLQNQLSELLAQYLQKELVPDTITKAASQGLLMSRKTRKNIQKLESAVGAGSMDVSALTASLEKFNNKQTIEAPTGPTLEEFKTTMLGDMARRMQRQKKSDGPLLFLTLVVFLFAKHNAGVVYATGKFAPKLLKQLKTVLDAEQYAQLEAWKEAAKTGTLSAKDREAMKQMVEDRV